MRPKYSSRAQQWNAFLGSHERASLDDWDSKKIALSVERHLEPGSSVLWLGLSSAVWPCSLALKSYRVTGIDFSVRAVLEAIALAKELNVTDRVRFYVEDIEESSVFDRTHDAIVSPAILTYLGAYSRIQSVHAAIMDSTRPGGLNFISEPLWAGRDLYFYNNGSEAVFLFSEGQLFDVYRRPDWLIKEMETVPSIHSTRRLFLVARRMKGEVR